MSLDMTSFDAALKTYYTDDKVINMVYKKNPALALIPKMEDFEGRSLPIPLIIGNPQNRSATFATAQAGTSTSNIKAFNLTRVKDYSFAQIDNETLEASKNNSGAFLQAAKTEIDGAINSLTRSLATGLFRSGWGDLGVIATGGVSGSVATLVSAAQAVNFEAGMQIVFSTSQNAAALRSTTPLVVSAVDKTLGTVTFTSALSGPGAAAGDWMFTAGDRDNSSTPTARKLSGFAAWCPLASPSSTSFFGVDRTAGDVNRLSGQRYDGRGVPIEEALIEGAVLSAQEGGAIDHYFMNFKQLSALEKSLGSKVQYVDLDTDVNISFRGIRVQGPTGPINVIGDQNCQYDRIFGLQLDTWKLYSIGKAVRVIDTDGNTMLRQATADGIEVRYGSYSNVGCEAPGFNVVIQTA